MQKKKALTLKKNTKSTPAHQKKASHRKKAQKSTMVLLKALTMIPVSIKECFSNILYCFGSVSFQSSTTSSPSESSLYMLSSLNWGISSLSTATQQTINHLSSIRDSPHSVEGLLETIFAKIK